MAKIQIDVELPEELILPYLQHNRDFEANHMQETLFAIWIPDAGKLTGDQMLAVMRSIKPPYGDTFFFRFPGARKE